MAHSKSEIKKAKNLLNKYAPKGEQLAYINSKEAKLLKSKGGAGKDVNVSGIKSYYGGGSPADSHNNESTSSGPSNNNGGDNDDNYNAADAYISPQQPKSILSTIGGFIKGAVKGAAGAAFTASTFGVGPAVGSALYQGGKKAVSYVTKNIGGRMTRTRVNAEEARLASAKRSGSFFVPDSKAVSSAVTNYNFNRNNNNNNGSDNTPPARNVGGKIIKLSPTTAEISQSSATDASPYDNRKTKARGRSMMIMTSSRGINRNNTLTLGKPSLLGA